MDIDDIKRSFSVKSKKRSSFQKIELAILPKDTMQENESVNNNFNESQDDIVNE